MYKMYYDGYKKIMERKHVFIFDTNVYLELYRLSAETSKDVLSLLNEIKNDIIVPYHILKEFNSNSKEVQKAQFGKYVNIEKELRQDIDKL